MSVLCLFGTAGRRVQWEQCREGQTVVPRGGLQQQQRLLRLRQQAPKDRSHGHHTLTPCRRHGDHRRGGSGLLPSWQPPLPPLGRQRRRQQTPPYFRSVLTNILKTENKNVHSNTIIYYIYDILIVYIYYYYRPPEPPVSQLSQTNKAHSFIYSYQSSFFNHLIHTHCSHPHSERRDDNRGVGVLGGNRQQDRGTFTHTLLKINLSY